MPFQYAERMSALVSDSPAWQVTPMPGEHIRELLSEPGGLAAPAGSHPGYKNHGGSSIATPKLVLIDFGQWWGDVAKRNQFAKEVMEYGYLSKLGPYGSGNGVFLGAVQGPTFVGNVTDAQIQFAIKAMIAAGTVPQPDGQTLYAACLPDGVHVIDNGAQGDCDQYCGYHSAIDEQTFYTVQPATLCGGCHGGFEPFVAFCMVLAHEIAEACTDAWPGRGWFVDDPADSMNGAENADLEAWFAVVWGPWTVQGYYTIAEGNTVGPYSPPPVQPQATKLVVLSDAKTMAAQVVNVSVTALDDGGNVVLNYAGTVSFTSSDRNASLPVAYAYTPSDRGTHTFPVTFNTVGSQSVVATDGKLARSVTLIVAAMDYSRLLPLVAWIVQNYHGVVIDAFEKIDPLPAHVATFEQWRSAMKTWGMIS